MLVLAPAGLAVVVADAGALLDIFAASEVEPELDPEEPAGVAAGVAAGRVVIGVGSAGSGFVKTVETRSDMPSSFWLCRYLYQVVKLSVHVAFPVAYFGSLPATATARA